MKGIIYAIYFIEFLAVWVLLMYAADGLPKTKRFFQTLRRLWRFKNFRRSADRQIEVNRRHLAEKVASVRGIVY